MVAEILIIYPIEVGLLFRLVLGHLCSECSPNLLSLLDFLWRSSNLQEHVHFAQISSPRSVEQSKCSPEVLLRKQLFLVHGGCYELVVLDLTVAVWIEGANHLLHVWLFEAEMATDLCHVLLNLVIGQHAVLVVVPLQEHISCLLSFLRVGDHVGYD